MPYLIAGGHRLEYECVGARPDHAPTLVFLHEALGCVAMWKDFPAQVAASVGYEAFVYSRQGYGRSAPLGQPRTPRYVHEEALVVLPEVLHAANIEQAILIGDSDGASIALIHASNHAPELLGIILEAPHVFVEDITVEGIRRAGEIYRTTDLAEKLARYHGDQTDAVFRSWHDTWLSPGFRSWNIEDCLPRITCPVMIIQGENDEYGSIKQVEAIASQVSGPVDQLMLPDCGHTPHRDQPAATHEAMIRFIASLS